MTIKSPPQQPASLTIEQALRQAVAQHQAGQLQEAEKRYQSILKIHPNHPDANHNMGVLAVQMKQPDNGLPHFIAALKADPTRGQYWLSYIDALFQAGHLEAARQMLAHAQQQGLQGEAIEALAARLEVGAKVTEQSNAECQHAAEESQPVSSTAPHKSKNPSPQEIDALVALFTAGRYAEAATLAQAMTVSFPQYGFGWKVLGAAFNQMGRSTDALAPMQKAAALSPSDAETHYNLGYILKKIGRLDKAEASYRRALRIKQDYAEAHNNLGLILQDLSRLGEAEASYRRALQIKPDYAEAHNNLGLILQDLSRLGEAEASYRRALQIKPVFAVAYNNLGITLQDLGRLAEAETSFRHALAIKPDFAEAHNNLGSLLSYTGDLDQEISAYHQAFIIGPTENMGLSAAVMLAVRCYLACDFSACRSLLSASKPITAKTDAKSTIHSAYWNLLDLLLFWNQKANAVVTPSKDMETIYVIGESHSLPAHGIVVNYRGRPMRLAAQWIAGCKQWHLGNGKANRFRYKFEMIMARLPKRSTILLTIGEIDCRPGEGIIKVWKKSPEKTLDNLCQVTSGSYLQYITEIGARYGHQLVIGGVPAPNIPSEILTPEMADQHTRLIRTFNAILKKLALAAKMDFLDVFTLTDRGDGVASGEWHIDSHHLLPSAMTEAFCRHCLHQ